MKIMLKINKKQNVYDVKVTHDYVLSSIIINNSTIVDSEFINSKIYKLQNHLHERYQK